MFSIFAKFGEVFSEAIRRGTEAVQRGEVVKCAAIYLSMSAGPSYSPLSLSALEFACLLLLLATCC